MAAFGTRATPAEFRRVMGAFPTGVTVLTATSDEGPRGMTANAVTPLSLEPLLILACVQLNGRFARIIAAATGFAVNILGDHQAFLAKWFASPQRLRDRDEFDGLPWRPSEHGGAPLLRGTAAHLDCRTVDTIVRGDHVIVVGEVLDCRRDAGVRPLVFLAGSYLRLDGTSAVPGAPR